MTRHAGLARWGATLAWLVGVTAVVAALVFIFNTDPAYRVSVDVWLFLFLANPLTYTTVGAAIARRRPDHYAGWTLLASGLAFSLVLAGVAYTYAGLPPNPTRLPGAEIVAWIAGAMFVPALALMVCIFLLRFPDGSLLSPRWRAAVVFVVATITAYAVAELIRPGGVSEDFPGVTGPIAVPAELGPAIQVVGDAANLGVSIGALLAGLSVILRYRRSGERERAQIKWIAWIGSAMAGSFLVTVVQPSGPINDIAFFVGFALLATLPVVVAIAILRYRLYDIDRLINRTVVYGSLTALLAGLYAASIRLFQAIFVALTGDESDAAIVLTTLVLATTLTPLKGRLERVADRVFGDAQHASDEPQPSRADATLSDTTGAAPWESWLEEPAFQERLDELIAQGVRRHAAHGVDVPPVRATNDLPSSMTADGQLLAQPMRPADRAEAT
jgi:hypothetical protein